MLDSWCNIIDVNNYGVYIATIIRACVYIYGMLCST